MHNKTLLFVSVTKFLLRFIPLCENSDSHLLPSLIYFPVLRLLLTPIQIVLLKLFFSCLSLPSCWFCLPLVYPLRYKIPSFYLSSRFILYHASHLNPGLPGHLTPSPLWLPFISPHLFFLHGCPPLLFFDQTESQFELFEQMRGAWDHLNSHK